MNNLDPSSKKLPYKRVNQFFLIQENNCRLLKTYRLHYIEIKISRDGSLFCHLFMSCLR